jgi:hypothetical protein
MFKITRKSRLVKVAAAAAAIGSLAAIGFAGNSPANADPKQYTDPIFGFGSDTLQDVTNAFAGFSNGINYTPLQTSAATGTKQIVSWDAFAPGAADPTAVNCITTKTGAPQIQRPNGSSNGVRALSAAFNVGQRWPAAAGVCGATRPMAGVIDFARSSASVTTTSGPLVYIPFGRDAFGFGYVRPSGSPVTSITAAELTALHATGPQLIGGVPVIACGIQTGSGTYSSWMTSLGLATNGTGDPGTNTCNNAGVAGSTLGRLQENNGPDLTNKATVLSSMTSDICDGVAGGAPVACTNAQLVIGFSASQFIARSNNVGTPNPNLGANGGLGAINGVPAATGTAPNLVPNSAWYSNTTFGRDVTFVLAAAAIEGPDALPALQDMFVGPTSKVCSATATIQSHGFLALGGACGSTTQRGPYRS